MKALKPSIREKKRYLLIKGKNLKSNVDRAILEFIGVLGMSKASPEWIELNKNSGVLSVNRKSVNYIRASFAASKDRIEVLKVSGTLKSLKE